MMLFKNDGTLSKFGEKQVRLRISRDAVAVGEPFELAGVRDAHKVNRYVASFRLMADDSIETVVCKQRISIPDEPKDNSRWVLCAKAPQQLDATDKETRYE